jgi:hypothetical protein
MRSSGRSKRFAESSDSNPSSSSDSYSGGVSSDPYRTTREARARSRYGSSPSSGSLSFSSHSSSGSSGSRGKH